MTLAHSENFWGAPKTMVALSYSLWSLYVNPALIMLAYAEHANIRWHVVGGGGVGACGFGQPSDL